MGGKGIWGRETRIGESIWWGEGWTQPPWAGVGYLRSYFVKLLEALWGWLAL